MVYFKEMIKGRIKMEDKNLNLEQPAEHLLKAQGEGILQGQERGEDLREDVGSKLGKFKDAEALMYAYNNLQSDYTKK